MITARAGTVAVLGVIVAGLPLVVSGCAGWSVNPSASSYTCTPSARAPGGPCSREQYEAQVADQQLYEEALRVHQRYRAEEVRIYRAGGLAGEATDELKATLAGDYLAEATAGLQTLFKQGLVVLSGDLVTAKVLRNFDLKYQAIVSISACEDATGVTFSKEDRPPWKGVIVRNTYYFQRQQGELKIWHTDGDVVSSCNL